MEATDGKYGWRLPVIDERVAGLTQATCCPADAVCPESRLTPWPGRAKKDAAGGVEPKVEYASTQPVCVAEPHVGMFLKLPPTVFPTGTWTLPPRMMAETISLRSRGDGSTWASSSLISMEAPWECPMNTMGLP